MFARRILPFAGALTLALVLTTMTAADEPQTASESPIVHNVYFSLKDKSPESVQKLIDACHKYLEPQPGVTFFACGAVADYQRSVNDRDWDVGLHVVFETAAAHDRYQDDEMHQRFISENKETWEKVRVFDTVGR